MIENVKIGPINYNVRVDSSMIGGQLVGEIAYREELIRLQPDCYESQLFLSLLHEILHGVFHGGGHKQDENLIEFLSHSLYQLFLDNPNFIDMIKDLTKK